MRSPKVLELLGHSVGPRALRGSYLHTIDTSGRASIPAVHRVELLRLGGDRPPVLTLAKDHLELYPADVWEEVERGLGQRNELDPPVQELQRFVVGGAREAPLDAHGRIRIPKEARAHVGLKGRVQIVGVMSKLELWNPDTFWNATQAILEALERVQMHVDQQE